MQSADSYDVPMTSGTEHIIIVGAGIVGLATAFRLGQARPSARLTVIDKESTIGVHQTGHNSGVLHSGIYYKPGSTKARTCRAGRSQMVEYCEARGIDHDVCGKVIVATDQSQLPALDTLEQRAAANGVTATRIDRAALAELEPHAAGIDGLHVPDAGIVDYGAVCRALADDVVRAGATIRYGTEVTAIDERDDGVRVAGADGTELEADLVITCGGLHSDRLARMAQPDRPERILPFRGEYYELRPGRRDLVNNLIYPVPDPRFPFLGVHLTRMTDGTIHAGPNAVLALAREGYRWRDVDARDLLDVVRYPGWWRLAAAYWRTGLGEYHRSLSKAAFVRALQELVPDLHHGDLVPSPAGVRAQAVSRTGQLLDDFVWSETTRVVSVINAPSPAATASLAIGQQIAGQALGHL